MTAPGRQVLAARGEQRAGDYLKEKKYRILDRNYRCALGEIDLVAERDGVIVFVEVKTRTSRSFGEPEEAVTRTKQRKLGQLAEYYLKAKQLHGRDVRFDVLSVLENSADGTFEISHFESAFEF